MKHIYKISALILVCVMVLSSVPAVSTAEEISETYVYGDLPSSVEYIESLEEFDPGDYVNANARSSVLSESVDLSTSPYFPAIGDQGNVGACSSFASVYYQFTYEANKSLNMITTPENTFCPFYIYGLVGQGENEGSSLSDNYSALNKIGCIRYSDVSEEDLDTFVERCYFWPNNDEARLAALENRSTEEVIMVDCTDRTSGGSLCEADNAITFDGGLKDYSLDNVKRALSLGKILTVSAYFKIDNVDFSNLKAAVISDEDESSHIEYVMTQAFGEGNHSVAIVGYDDNFEVDANGDNLISDWERGAFKIANSWGEDANYHNDGYIWVMYDAINKVSACPDSSYNISNRTSFLKSYIQVGCYYPFYLLNFEQRDVYLAGKLSYSTNNKYKLQLSYAKASANSSLTNNNWTNYPKSDTRLSHTYNTDFSYNGSIIFDFTDYDSTFSDYCAGYDYYFRFLSNNEVGSEIIRSCSVIDNAGETILEINPISINWMQYSITHGTLNLTLGDLDYDGILTDDDRQVIRDYMVGNIEYLSNVKEYLADVNGDGLINGSDSLALKLLIDGN